jgi:hypothetical protein
MDLETDENMTKTFFECDGGADAERQGYGCNSCYVGCNNPDRDPQQWTDWKAVGSKNGLNVSVIISISCAPLPSITYHHLPSLTIVSRVLYLVYCISGELLMEAKHDYC